MSDWEREPVVSSRHLRRAAERAKRREAGVPPPVRRGTKRMVVPEYITRLADKLQGR